AAGAAGLDPALFVEAVLASSGANTLLGRMKARLLNPPRGAVDETFTLRRFRDYTRLAAEVEASYGLAPSLVAAADDFYRRCVAAGFGEEHYASFMLALTGTHGFGHGLPGY